MKNLVIFDLDGVLVDSKEYHFLALNEALSSFDPKYVISKNEHLLSFDGLPTKSKLQKLTDSKGLPVNLHDEVWKVKQAKTLEILKSQVNVDTELVRSFKYLKSLGLYYCGCKQ